MVTRSAEQWRGLITVAVVITAAGVVLAILGSLQGHNWIGQFGTVMAFGGFVLFLVARIQYSRSRR
jgi:hypothetical protein